jgi:hypothetical protein
MLRLSNTTSSVCQLDTITSNQCQMDSVLIGW